MKVEEMFVEDGPLWSTGVTHPTGHATAVPSAGVLAGTVDDPAMRVEPQGDLGGGEDDVAGED